MAEHSPQAPRPRTTRALRSGHPSLLSPPCPGARPAGPLLPSILTRVPCRSCAPPAGARPVVAWPFARGQHHGTADYRVPSSPGAPLAPPRAPSRRPLCASRAPQKPSRHSSSVTRAAGGVCVHGNGLSADGRVSADYSLRESRELGRSVGAVGASRCVVYSLVVWLVDYCCTWNLPASSEARDHTNTRTEDVPIQRATAYTARACDPALGQNT